MSTKVLKNGKKSTQIKSKERVNKFAEVFTGKREVNAMCNLIPSEIWENVGSTFLEPSCGNGNFLAEILKRKLKLCDNNVEQGLAALKSIYGIDLLQDNVEECKCRLFNIFIKCFPKAPATTGLEAIRILENNIVCGDSLKLMEVMEERK